MSGLWLIPRSYPGVAGLIALWVLLVASAAAQQPTLAADEIAAIAADEQTLWVVRAGSQRSQIYRRGVGGVFEPSPPLNATIISAVSASGVLYTFLEGGEFWSLNGDTWTRELDLPGRARPLNLVAGLGGLYALLPSPPPGALDCQLGGATQPSTQPFDAAGAALCVARYDSRGWTAVAACPPDLDDSAADSLQPRLGVILDGLCLFWLAPRAARIEYARLDAQEGSWVPRGTTPQLPDLRGFWITTVGRLPTIIAATRAADGGDVFSALRLLGSGAGDSEWRLAPLELSELPAGTEPGPCETALGFNQHAVLLFGDRAATALLRFGRSDAGPTETTLRLGEVFDRREPLGDSLRSVQGVTLLVLFAVLLSLFLFRRGALARALELPEGCAPALALQRLLAWAIDLAPFAFVAAFAVDVSVFAALRELGGWAVGGDVTAGRFPAANTLLWWGISVGMHTLYSLVMELATRRTVGKTLLGMRLLSEAGTPPRVRQTIIRNLFRLLEMLPPLWILAFLVVLSRNRQRLGDLFARTVVVRRTPADTDQPRDRE